MKAVVRYCVCVEDVRGITPFGPRFLRGQKIPDILCRDWFCYDSEEMAAEAASEAQKVLDYAGGKDAANASGRKRRK